MDEKTEVTMDSGKVFFQIFREILKAVAHGEMEVEPLERRALSVIYKKMEAREALTMRQRVIINEMRNKLKRIRGMNQ